MSFKANCMERGPPVWYSELSPPRLLANVAVAWPNVHPGPAEQYVELIVPKFG